MSRQYVLESFLSDEGKSDKAQNKAQQNNNCDQK